MEIKIFLRDINGKRSCLVFKNETDFNNRFNSKEYDTDNYEIMMVTWGEHCVFSALVHETLYFEELIGFFG